MNAVWRGYITLCKIEQNKLPIYRHRLRVLAFGGLKIRDFIGDPGLQGEKKNTGKSFLYPISISNLAVLKTTLAKY